MRYTHSERSSNGLPNKEVPEYAYLSTFFIITVSAKRNEDSLANMAESIKSLKTLCNQSDIKLTELRI